MAKPKPSLEERLKEARDLITLHGDLPGVVFGEAKLGSFKPPAQEYKLNTKEGNALGENVDTLAYLNEIGKEGWIAMEIREMVVPTGMINDKQESINKVVLAVLSRRPVYTSEAE
jgi:hypothetical protein